MSQLHHRCDFHEFASRDGTTHFTRFGIYQGNLSWQGELCILLANCILDGLFNELDRGPEKTSSIPLRTSVQTASLPSMVRLWLRKKFERSLISYENLHKKNYL